MKIFNTMFQKIFLFSLLLGITASCSKTDSNPDFSAIDKQVIEEYLTVKKLTAQSTPSGLYYIITTPGGAVHPTINDSVTAYYRGYLANGNIFDQTTTTPVEFPLSGVIAGWKEGLQLIGAGGKIKLLIPSALGYGGVSKPGIPMNSVTIFDVELVSFTN
jgi:FKBP-type peptidyl-prolyl cis-trans isomerase FkpA